MIYKNFKLNTTCLPTPEVLKTKKIGIVKTKWNTDIIEALYKQCVEQLLMQGVQESNITVYEVPGAFELPYAAQQMVLNQVCDVCICLGAIIQGDTAHFDVLAHAVTQRLLEISTRLGKPLILGVLTCTKDQAIERVQQQVAIGWADSALMMLNIAPIEDVCLFESGLHDQVNV